MNLEVVQNSPADADATPPVATVVIPTRNRPDAIQQCLDLIHQQIKHHAEVEVIVCDDSDDSATQEIVRTRFASVRWLRGERKGAGENRNLGARAAAAPFLVFVDDDCLPQPTWLSAYLAAARSTTVAQCIYVGPTRCPGGLPSLSWEAPINETANGMPSCNFALSRADFLALAGFDGRFIPAFEDMELQARLIAAGFRAELLPDAVVDHPARKIPAARTLAMRWYPQVIFALDLGAPPARLYRPYLRHVLAVITSRIREHSAPIRNLHVLPRYFAEFVCVAIALRGWIQKASDGPRSLFWAQPAHRAKVRGFGIGARGLEAIPL